MIRRGMRLGWALVAVMLLQPPTDASAQTSEPAAGVALDLAMARAANVSQLRYDLALSIPLLASSPVTGTSVLRFRLADASKPLVIDFEAEGAT